MDRKLRCIEPRYLVLLITSVLFLPLRDSFQTAVVHRPPPSTARCSMRPQHQAPTRSTGYALLPTRRLPRLLRPLKGSASKQDVSGDDEQVAGEDDSMKALEQPSPRIAAAAGDPTESTAEGDGEDPKEARAATPAAPAAAAAAVDPDLDLEAEVANFEFAPPMTVRKFKTMQDRRVPVSIKYSGGGGFKRYFEEIAMVLKRHFPDVIIDREIVEVSSTREEEVFEIRIDGKLVCAKRRGKPGVFLHMETFAQAIRKARQRRRPGSIVYGDQETYQNVKTLTDQRTADDSLERDFKDFTSAAESTETPNA